MIYLRYNLMCCRDVAQFGSALAWGVRGRRFKSCHPDKKPHTVFVCGFFIVSVLLYSYLKDNVLILSANSFAFSLIFSAFSTSPGLLAVSINANFGGSMKVLFIFNALMSC